MTTSVTIERTIHICRQARGRHDLREGAQPDAATVTQARVPRLTRLMALAIRFDHLLHTGQIRDQAELARLGQVTRARVSQILGLVHLAPDIQEQLLFLKGGQRGAELLLADLQPITRLADWTAQRRRWSALRRRSQQLLTGT